MSLDDINVEISDSLLAFTLELHPQLSGVLNHLGLAHPADFDSANLHSQVTQFITHTN